MTDIGIDYGMGTANIDTSTGIRYGVISIDSLDECAWESFEPDYGEPTCPSCGNTVVEFDADTHDHYQGRFCDFACDTCERVFVSDECYSEEPIGQTLDDGKYMASIDSYNDVFIVKSPYYTFAQFCSPCAPGACHLDNPLSAGEGHPKAYCFGPEWFEHNKAPYAVYRVSDGVIVQPAPTE